MPVGPPGPIINYEYPDTVQRLVAMLAQGEREKLQRELAQAQLAQQTAEAERAAARDTRQATREDLARELQLAGLQQAQAKETPLSEAERVPLEAQPLPGLTEERGGLSEEEAKYIGGDTPVPKRQVEITLPGGRKIPLAPLQYKEEAKAEALQDEAEKMARTLKQLGLKEEMVQDIRADHRPTTPARKSDVWDTKTKRAARVTPEEEAQEPGRYVPYRTSEHSSGGGKEEINEESAGAVARAWVEGRAFPATQKETTAALVYMERHRDEFPRMPRKQTPQQQGIVLTATTTLDRIADLRHFYEKVKDKVGPISYQLNELGLKLPGISEDPDFVGFNVALRQLDNLDIRRITGAAVGGPSEADRLMKGMATGGLRPKDFEAALRIMEMDAEREREITLFGSRAKGGKTKDTSGGGSGAAAGGTVETWIRDPATGKLRRK